MNPMRLLFWSAVFALLVFPAPVRAVLDIRENGGQGDGLSDIWQMKHKIPAGAGNLDSDGDGATNANEAGAGTDPNAPGDIVKITSMQMSGGNVVLTWPSVLGKRYRIQQSTSLTSPNWTAVTNYLNGTGAEVTDSTPSAAGAFYRVAVYDMDTDGDGLTDWEERQLGLDPENPRSHGLSNPPDLQWATAALQTTPAQQVVTVEALESSISEYAGATSFIVRRSAGLAEVTVHFTVSGGATSGTDYDPIGTTVTIPFGASSVNIPLHALSDSLVESPESVIVTLAADPAYTVGQPAAAGVIIEDYTNTAGTGLLAQFWNEGALSDTVPPVFPGAPKLTRIDPTVDFSWPDGTSPSSPATTITHNNFSSRWSGEVMPDFAQLYTFSIDINRGGRVWVNGQLVINNWPPNTLTSAIVTGTPIALEAGKRYPIVFEQYDNSGAAVARLRWQSANQVNPATGIVEAHVIPQNHLFPTVAPQILSPLELLTFVGGTPVSYQITASATPTSYAAANLPPGLSINTTTGLITGGPTVPGFWRVVLSATNSVGTGSAILEITVLQTGGGVVREKWTGVSGSDVSSIPLGTAPTGGTSLLTSLQSPSNDGDNFGVRIRGYVTAPTTGVYEFWLAADEAAELYISDDAEPVNSWKRAAVTAPTSAPPTWTTAAQTPLLYLTAGNRYFFEVRHKEATGSDFLAVGWSKPGEPTTAPSEIIPGYLLTQYVAPAPVDGQSALYITSLNAQANAATNGYGSASLQLTADKTQAIVRFTNSNLTGPITQKHVHSGADGGLIMFDLDAQPPNPDGSFTWNLSAVNGIADKDGDGDSDVNDVIKLIQNGDAYLNLHTAAFPAGEIKGFFRLAQGSQTFVPPPAVADWTTDPQNNASVRANAVRFLQQASFGATEADISYVMTNGYSAWIDDQFTKPVYLHFPIVYANRNTTNPQNSTYIGDYTFNAWWQQSITAGDQLRQRVAFALSEILVTSEAGVLDDRADALSDYYDTLLIGHLDPDSGKNQVNPVIQPAPLAIPGITGFDGGSTLTAGAFGNFRDILLAVTLHPAMGRYLDMVQNDKPNISTGRIPNENYAREILQLFSLGLYRLHPDGSLVLDSNGMPIATYDQDVVIGFAHTFTGWDYHYTGAYRTSLGAGSNWLEPMREVPNHHFTGQKRLLNHVVIPGLATVGGLPLDPYATHTSSQYNDPTYQALAAKELMASHDHIFNHPNIGPFICRQLIQRLVTSTPSRGYIYRVVQKFNNNGTGVRGDMKAVIKAILLDSEARSRVAAATQGFGKQREPLLRVTQMARAFPAANNLTGTWVQDGGAIFVNTTVPHRLSSSQTVILNFGDSTPASNTPLATSGSYANSTLGGTYTTTATQFAVRTKDIIRSTYVQSGTTVTVTTQSSVAHGLTTGNHAYVRFRSGTLPSQMYPVTVTSTTAFTIDVGAANAGTITTAQQCDVAFLRGGYTLSKPVSPATTSLCTITTTTVHGLTNGANVFVDFVDDTTSSGSFAPVDELLPITVISPTQFTVMATWPTAAPAGVTSLSNSINAAAQTPVLDRGGLATGTPPTGGFAVTSGYQDYTMGNTDSDLSQTPMGSPTVFNFFLPDYQYPGELSQAGLITPEFQLASDTSVVRQSNFLYNGLFNPDNATGLSSFKSGGGDITLDISPWMDIRPGSANPWTDNNTGAPTNDNLRNLIRELGTLLMGGQMTSAMEDQIYGFVSNNNTANGNPLGHIAYTNGATTTFATATTTQLTQRRDRVRAVIHLIVTSPEYTIQK